jgi:hypothetical protein
LSQQEERGRIKAANSLIQYLRRHSESENQNTAQSGKRKVTQDDLDMIARLRKPSKKQRQSARMPGQIAFDAATQKLFEITGTPIPLSIDDVPATLRTLIDKATVWNAPDSVPNLDRQLSPGHQESAL